MTRAVKQCNYNNEYHFREFFPITKKVGKLTFRKDNIKFSVESVNDYGLSALSGKRYISNSYAINQQPKYGMVEEFVTKVLNITYHLHNGDSNLPSDSITGFVMNSSCADDDIFNSTLEASKGNYYAQNCLPASLKDTYGDYMQTNFRGIQKIFEADRLLDVD